MGEGGRTGGKMEARFLAEGHSMKQAAVILKVTPRTVAFHKALIMQDNHLFGQRSRFPDRGELPPTAPVTFASTSGCETQLH